jgi:membrane protein
MSFLRSAARSIAAGVSCFSQHDGPLLAAGLAYYLAFSLFPMMLLLVALVGWALRFTAAGQGAQQRILAAVSEQASPALSQQLAATLGAVEDSAATGSLVGAGMLLITALAIFTQIDSAFDRMWENGQTPRASWLTWLWALVFKRLKAALMFLGVGAFVLVGMIASIVLKGLQENLASMMTLSPLVTKVAQPAIHLGLNFLAFAAVYKFLPKHRVRWRAALAGAALAAVLWEAGRQVLAAYVVGDKLPSAYGLIGSFMAVMLWTYYAMIVLLLGVAHTRIVNDQRPSS